MKKNRFFLLAGICLLAACGENNNRDDNDSIETADSANEAKRDNAQNPADQESVDFLMWAANATMTEAAYAEAAKTKASRTDIKNFAATLEKDHMSLQDQIKTLAQQKNITLPASVSDESRKDMDKMTEKTGNEYDKAFIKKMIDEHQECIRRYEKAANRTEDAQVQSFANQSLSSLRMHLDAAKAIEKKYW